jgi:hypothetical protein
VCLDVCRDRSRIGLPGQTESSTEGSSPDGMCETTEVWMKPGASTRLSTPNVDDQA